MNAKKNVVLQAILNMVQKGAIKNKAANQVLQEVCTEVVQEESTNIRIINEITQKLDELEPLSEEQAMLLKDALVKHPSLSSDEATTAVEVGVKDETTNSLHFRNFSITDLSNSEQDFQDEYNFILENTKQVRKYLLELRETSQDGQSTLTFYNYVFGNFSLNYSNTNFACAFSRSNVIKSILDNFGYISLNGDLCTHSIKRSIFDNLSSAGPYANLCRENGSIVVVLKIGEIKIMANNKPTESLDQYLICDIDLADHRQLYVCYGKINFNLLHCSSEYNYAVANVLLSTKNLNSSRYIGSIYGTSLVKKPILFEESVCTCSLN